MKQSTAPRPAPGGADRPDQPERADRGTRQAALWATLIALPLTVLVALLLVNRLTPDRPSAENTPPAGADASAAPVPDVPVPMTAAALTERQTVVCRALLSHLPASVRELPQRPVTAGSEQNAAYGEPPMTVACGTPPASFPPTDDVWTVNRVCWHLAQGSDAVVLNTVDREVPVRVTLPRAYAQPLQWVPEISDALVASVPSIDTVPPGCRP